MPSIKKSNVDADESIVVDFTREEFRAQMEGVNISLLINDVDADNPIVIDFTNTCEELLAQMKGLKISLPELWKTLQEEESLVGVDSLPLSVFVTGLNWLIDNVDPNYHDALNHYRNDFYKRMRENAKDINFVHLAKDLEEDENVLQMLDEIIHSSLSSNIDPVFTDHVTKKTVPFQIENEEVTPEPRSISSSSALTISSAVLFFIFLANFLRAASGQTVEKTSEEEKEVVAHDKSSIMRFTNPPAHFTDGALHSISQAIANNVRTEMHDGALKEALLSHLTNQSFAEAAYELRNHIVDHPHDIVSKNILIDMLYTGVVSEIEDGECESILRNILISNEKVSEANFKEQKVLWATLIVQRYVDQLPSEMHPKDGKRLVVIKSKLPITNLRKAISYLQDGLTGGSELNRSQAKHVLRQLIMINVINYPLEKARQLMMQEHESKDIEQQLMITSPWENHAAIAIKSADEPIPRHLITSLHNDVRDLPNDNLAKVILQSLLKIDRHDTHLMALIANTYEFILNDHISATRWWKEASDRGNMVAHLRTAAKTQTMNVAEQERVGKYFKERHIGAGYIFYIASMYKSQRYERFLEGLDEYLDDVIMPLSTHYSADTHVLLQHLSTLNDALLIPSQRIRLATSKARLMVKLGKKDEAFELIKETQDSVYFKQPNDAPLAKIALKKVQNELLLEDNQLWNTILAKVERLKADNNIDAIVPYLEVLATDLNISPNIKEARVQLHNIGVELVKNHKPLHTGLHAMMTKVYLSENNHYAALMLIEEALDSVIVVIENYPISAHRNRSSKDMFESFLPLIELIQSQEKTLTARCMQMKNRISKINPLVNLQESSGESGFILFYEVLIGIAGLIVIPYYKTIIQKIASSAKHYLRNAGLLQRDIRRIQGRMEDLTRLANNKAKDRSSSRSATGRNATKVEQTQTQLTSTSEQPVNVSSQSSNKPVTVEASISILALKKNTRIARFEEIYKAKNDDVDKYTKVVTAMAGFSDFPAYTRKFSSLKNLCQDRRILLDKYKAEFQLLSAELGKPELFKNVKEDASNSEKVKENIVIIKAQLKKLKELSKIITSMTLIESSNSYKQFEDSLSSINGGSVKLEGVLLQLTPKPAEKPANSHAYQVNLTTSSHLFSSSSSISTTSKSVPGLFIQTNQKYRKKHFRYDREANTTIEIENECSTDKTVQPEASISLTSSTSISSSHPAPLPLPLHMGTLYRKCDATLMLFKQQSRDKRKKKKLSFEEKIRQDVIEYIQPIYQKYCKHEIEDDVAIFSMYYYIARLLINLYEREKSIECLNAPAGLNKNSQEISDLRHYIIHYFSFVYQDKPTFIKFCDTLILNETLSFTEIKETTFYKNLQRVARSSDKRFDPTKSTELLNIYFNFLQIAYKNLNIQKLDLNTITARNPEYFAAIKAVITLIGEHYASMYDQFTWLVQHDNKQQQPQDLLDLNEPESALFSHLIESARVRNRISHSTVNGLTNEVRHKLVWKLAKESTHFNATTIQSLMEKINKIAQKIELAKAEITKHELSPRRTRSFSY